MINFKTILAGIFTVMCFSCNHEDLNLHGNNEHLFTMAQARQVAIELNLENPFKVNSKQDNQIVEEFIVHDGNLPAYYIFNYSDQGGFSIISADTRTIPVLAYSMEGELPYGNDENLGLTMQLEEYVKYIAMTREKGSEKNATDHKLHDARLKVQKWGPFIKTKWGQSGEYNDKAPYLACSSDDPQAKTGCLATAMAQLIRYWRYPDTYKWSDMPLGNNPTPEIAQLLRDCGDAVYMDWGCKVSTATAYDANIAMKYKFDYSSPSTYNVYDFHTVSQSIKMGKPVILIGCKEFEGGVYKECHGWLADGMLIGQDGFYRYHMNWGWKGSGDGWYYVSEWKNYQLNKQMMAHLSPESQPRARATKP